jgi:DNA repair ATPase RecN
MQSLDDHERKLVLGEVLFDELKAIREYVQEIPAIKQKLNQVDERLIEVERIVKIHEIDIRQIRQHLQLA